MSAIYLDNHSTTAVDPRVLDIMLPFFSERFGNAASLNHVFGQDAADAVGTAREQIARLLNTSSKSLVFTSGATEANNLAIKGLMTRVARRNKDASGHLITNAAEHRSVLDPARKLHRVGFDVTILPVNHLGQVDPQQVANAIRPDTVLVSVMLANNEVGTLNPVVEIGDLCHKKDVLFHCDAVQALGRIPIDLACLPIDLLSISAHKCYGPMGVGALFVRRGAPRVQLDPLFDGGGHENRMRSGTLPVPLVVGFGACCELASGCFDAESVAIAELRDRLWNGLQSELDGVVMNGTA
jgi:cysteine desulfurase